MILLHEVGLTVTLISYWNTYQHFLYCYILLKYVPAFFVLLYLIEIRTSIFCTVISYWNTYQYFLLTRAIKVWLNQIYYLRLCVITRAFVDDYCVIIRACILTYLNAHNACIFIWIICHRVHTLKRARVCACVHACVCACFSTHVLFYIFISEVYAAMQLHERYTTYTIQYRLWHSLK